MNIEVKEYGLVRTPELRTSKPKQDGSTTDYMFLTLAESYTKRDNNGNYVDNGRYFVTAVVYGHQAQMIAAANLQPGTRLLVVGETTSQLRQAYTDSNGVAHPEQYERQLRVDMIAVAFGKGQSATPFRVNKQDGGNSTPTQSAPAQNPNPTPPQDFGGFTQPEQPAQTGGTDPATNFAAAFDEFFS